MSTEFDYTETNPWYYGRPVTQVQHQVKGGEVKETTLKFDTNVVKRSIVGAEPISESVELVPVVEELSDEDILKQIL